MSYRNLSDFWKCLTELSGNLCILWSHCCYYSLLRSAFLADFCHDGGNFASLNRRTRAICLNWSMIIFRRHCIDTWLAPYADTLPFSSHIVAHAYSIDRYVSPDISCQPQVYPVVRGFEMMCTVKLRPYRSNFGLLQPLLGLMDYCAAPLILAYYSHCLGLEYCAAPISAYYSHCLGLDYCAALILAYYSHCLGLDYCAALILAYYSHCLGLDYCVAPIPMFSSACVLINWTDDNFINITD